MKLQMYQAQQLTISATQRQALELLAMNGAQLAEFIDREQLENPLLEVDPVPGPEELDSLVDIAQWLQDAAPRVENGVYRDEAAPERELSAGSGRTYREDLKEQLYTMGIGGGRVELAEKMIDLIDSRGFLPYNDLELCQLLRCSPGACQTALRTIRTLEPFGVGSRDLGEFLTRQLAQQGLLSPALTEICSSFLPQLARGDYREIAGVLGLEPELVRQCARLIAALRPSPLQGGEDGGPAEYIIPEITVCQGPGGLEAVVNDRWAGRVRISGYYQSYLEGAETPEVRDYLREKIRRARWLVASVDQRRRTMVALGEALLQLQREFFMGGELASITLRQAAERMRVHESTVSRAISGKYLRCARGTYPLRSFFSAGVPLRREGEDGDTTLSRGSVKDRILRLIREEDPEHPLSDDALRKVLYREGLDISRRTVAKYRQECGIPASTYRREETGGGGDKGQTP